MSDLACEYENCTVSQTGICILNNPPGECSNCRAVADPLFEDVIAGEPPLTAPSVLPRFSPSAALGLDDVRTMLAKRYGHVIGILGAPDSGKTALLVSLYLLIAHDKLAEFSFADSRSLLTFEDIARGARAWNEGTPPLQMTMHTDLGDSRSAGLLHVRIKRAVDASCIDLYIPDLPGEWSTNLIDANEHERLEFLSGAEAIWLTVDGQSLVIPTQRNNSIHRMKLLIDRIAALCPNSLPRLFLVVTRSDLGRAADSALEPIVGRAALHGASLQVLHVASFSNDANVAPGTGIAELIAATVAPPTNIVEFWPDQAPEGSRRILRFPKAEQP